MRPEPVAHVRDIQQSPTVRAAVDAFTAQIEAQDAWNHHVATALITVSDRDPADIVTEQFRPWRQP